LIFKSSFSDCSSKVCLASWSDLSGISTSLFDYLSNPVASELLKRVMYAGHKQRAKPKIFLLESLAPVEHIMSQSVVLIGI